MPLGVKVERKSAFLGFVYSNRAHLTHYIVRGLHRSRIRSVRSFHVVLHERKRRRKLHAGDLADARNLRRDNLLPCGVDEF